MPAAEQTLSPFWRQYRARFSGILRWPDLDSLWDRVREQPAGWYIYTIGQDLPAETVDADGLSAFLGELDSQLRTEHAEDYCGVVYVDSTTQPSMIKVYDPGNLGIVCGPSTEPVPPGWLLSRIPPEEISVDALLPNNRKRWWQRLFA